MTTRQFLSHFSGQSATFSVPRIFVQLTGDYEAAVFLSQCIYWFNKMDRPFYKTDADWHDELLINPSKLKRIRALLKPYGLNVVKKGLPAKNHYSIDFEKLEKALDSQLDQNELTSDQDRPKESVQLDQNDPTSEYENGLTNTEDYTEDYNSIRKGSLQSSKLEGVKERMISQDFKNKIEELKSKAPNFFPHFEALCKQARIHSFVGKNQKAEQILAILPTYTEPLLIACANDARFAVTNQQFLFKDLLDRLKKGKLEQGGGRFTEGMQEPITGRFTQDLILEPEKRFN